MKLETRGLISFIVYALLFFCISMSAIENHKYWIIVPCLWMIGVMGTYLSICTRYMKENNIVSMKNTEEIHQDNMNKLFIQCLFQWFSVKTPKETIDE